VLFGSDRQTNRAADYVLTPLSRHPLQTTALEAAAHGLVTLIREDGIYKPPRWADLAIGMLVGVITANVLLWLPPSPGILLVIGETFLLAAIAWLALHGGRAWIDLAHPLVIAGASYYLVIPYRLLNEYRKRWHYQEKSEVMSQLEQLKSNFLSLISHD